MLNKETLPTQKAVSFDIPSLDEISVKFVYAFFTPDERTNDSGNAAYQGLSVSGVSNDVMQQSALNAQQTGEINQFAGQVSEDVLTKYVPRYCIIRWTPLHVGPYTGADLMNNPAFGPGMLIHGNHVKPHINQEETITVDDFAVTSLYVPNQRARLNRLLQHSLRLRDIPESATTMEKAEALNKATNGLVKGQKIATIFSDTFLGIQYVNEPNKPSTFTTLEAESSISTQVHVSSKFAGDLAISMATNIGPVESSFIATARQHQSEYLATFTPGVTIDELRDWEPNLKIIDIEYTGYWGLPKLGTIGYLVERYIKTPEGMIPDKSFYVGGVNCSSYVDTEIKYGRLYSYRVRVVGVLQFSAPAGNENSWHRHNSVVASDTSPTAFISTRENRPPLPPDGIFYAYNYDKKHLNIRWQYPSNPQRDIAAFQVFRRRTINEPFELQVEYNFSRSQVAGARTDKPHTVRNVPDVRLCHSDGDFDRQSDFIYAVRSVDEHGLVSNYSKQMRVKFDRSMNKIHVSKISNSGAPGQYPNFFVDPTMKDEINDGRFAMDAMTDSGHKSARIYFNPEYLKVTDVNDDDIKLLALDKRNAFYKLHFINLDRQKSATVEINIKDDRTGFVPDDPVI